MLHDEVARFYLSAGLKPDRPIGVAFSGGPDSVALLAATAACGYRCVALHCNFHLRGDESMRDEDFARRTAAQLGCEFRMVDFDVDAHRAQTGESVEMACRSLRYDWFEAQLALHDGDPAQQLQCIALGHHADDSMETVMLNLTRGTGLKGLCGIPERRGAFLRPLLNFTRANIMAYLQQRGLSYVTDSTNALTDCRRNIWRNNLLPQITEAFPMFAKGVQTTAANLADDHRLLQSLIAGKARECICSDGCIDLQQVKLSDCAPILLWHLLRLTANGGCDRSTVDDMLQSDADGASGKIFRTTDGINMWLLDRGRLVPTTGQDTYIPKDAVEIDIDNAIRNGSTDTPLKLIFTITRPESFTPDKNNRTLWLDYDLLRRATSTLTLRRWHKGDRMAPFGMHGTKLISDIFTDAHLSTFKKAQTWLLTAQSTILWIPGIRSSSHFSLTGSTKKALRIDLGQ